ncbi:MAG: hypothetical protein LBU70_10795 [Chitinispirillales bacterium]|jgi:uncharacterized protein (TIGR02145 family)|nr:hypothetical protein [Chitinispirillales bacterium]
MTYRPLSSATFRAQWTTLANFAGGSSVAGARLRSLTGWDPLSGTLIPGTDDYGFSALPGGFRWSDGGFNDVDWLGYWWSATENGAANAWYRFMYSYISDVITGWSNKAFGFALRCLQN